MRSNNPSAKSSKAKKSVPKKSASLNKNLRDDSDKESEKSVISGRSSRSRSRTFKKGATLKITKILKKSTKKKDVVIKELSNESSSDSLDGDSEIGRVTAETQKLKVTELKKELETQFGIKSPSLKGMLKNELVKLLVK